MDAATITVIFKGTGMLLVIGGGIWIAKFGYQLYMDGAGHGRDQAAFEFGKLKIKAHSVGSIVMSTAFLWAFAGVLLSPNMEKKGDEIKVYSLDTPIGELEAIAIKSKIEKLQPSEQSSEKLKFLLSKALIDAKHNEKDSPLVRLNGKPALIDAYNVQTMQGADGKVTLASQVSANGKSVALNYLPIRGTGNITFIPVKPADSKLGQ